PVVVEPDIEEPWAGDLGRPGQRRQVDPVRNLLGDRTRVLSRGVCHRHAPVRLVVAKFRVGARPDGRSKRDGVGPLRDRSGERGAKPLEYIHGWAASGSAPTERAGTGPCQSSWGASPQMSSSA